MVTNNKFRVAVIGAGMSGILAAIKLREAGIENIVIYEKADRIGGTWRENTYPGLTCDVPAHSYTYSFEPYPGWSRYLKQPQIGHSAGFNQAPESAWAPRRGDCNPRRVVCVVCVGWS